MTPSAFASLIHTFGPIAVVAIIFAETGLLIGFFLPGDSLLVIAGVLASGKGHIGQYRPHLNLAVLLIGCFLAAAAGAQLGYVIGQRVGPALFNRPRFQEYVARAHTYFERYGNRTIVVARFVPVVRTFANPVAGMSEMNTRTFTVYNVASALLWTWTIILLGYFVGDKVKDTYIIPSVIVLSLIPIGIEVIRSRRGHLRG